MAAAEGDTLPGPGKQRIRDSLRPAEQVLLLHVGHFAHSQKSVALHGVQERMRVPLP